MGTKAEYLAALEARSFRVTEPVARELDPASLAAGVKAYNVTVFVEKAQPDGTVMLTSAVQIFFVFDEGEPGEDARTALKDWESETPNLFLDQVRTYCDNRVTAVATILKIVIDKVNADQEFALVTAYTLEADQVTPVMYFLAKDDQGAPYIQEFTG